MFFRSRTAEFELRLVERLLPGPAPAPLDVLVRLIEYRFGPLEPRLAERVRGAAPEQRAAWRQGLPTAGSVGELLPEEAPPGPAPAWRPWWKRAAMASGGQLESERAQ